MRFILAGAIAGLMATAASASVLTAKQAEKLFLASPTSKPALTKLETAARSGNAVAEDWLGLAYQSGFSHRTPLNYKLALKWFEKAAAQGYANAEFNLGAMYQVGEGAPQSDAEAEHWYRLAAAGGSIAARHSLRVLEELTP